MTTSMLLSTCVRQRMMSVMNSRGQLLDHGVFQTSGELLIARVCSIPGRRQERQDRHRKALRALEGRRALARLSQRSLPPLPQAPRACLRDLGCRLAQDAFRRLCHRLRRPNPLPPFALAVLAREARGSGRSRPRRAALRGARRTDEAAQEGARLGHRRVAQAPEADAGSAQQAWFRADPLGAADRDRADAAPLLEPGIASASARA